MMKNMFRQIGKASRNPSGIRGQGMVEFALVIPFLLLVVAGLVEFGFFFFVYSSVNSAAREAVRYGSAAGPSAVGVPYFQYCQGIREAAIRLGAFSGMEDAEIHIGYDEGPGTTQDWTQCSAGTQYSEWTPEQGDRLLVRITVAYQPIASMLGLPPINITGHSARTILQDVDVEATPLESPTEIPDDSGTPGPSPTQGPTSTPSNTPTRTPRPCHGSNCDETPVVCLTPIELGGCE